MGALWEEIVKPFLITLGVLTAIGLGFIITDCSAGSSVNYSCVVLEHYHRPAWTEVSSSTGSDGHVRVTTTRHPDQWWIYASDREREGVVHEAMATRTEYHSITNGADVTIAARQGKWTKITYFKYIESTQ